MPPIAWYLASKQCVGRAVGLPQNFMKNGDLFDDHKELLKAVPLTNLKARTQ